jgi:glycine cleavage system H protein
MVMFRVAVSRAFQLPKIILKTNSTKLIKRSFSTNQQLQVMYFTQKHEWVKVESDNVGTIGITSYAQEALGDIVYAQLPQPDDAVERGEECGALESVKAASEVYSPVSGTVTEKNEAVESAPALINTSAMEEGWLFKVKLSKPEEVDELMDQESYDKYLKEHEE